jgi:hypothetical protein
MLAAVALRREIAGEWALLLVGVLSVIFEMILAVLPGVGLLWLVGLYALAVGGTLIPYGVYILAEEILHVSGSLAVVTSASTRGGRRRGSSRMPPRASSARVLGRDDLRPGGAALHPGRPAAALHHR